MKSIVIFYSRSGNTQFVSEVIANNLDSDLLPLKDKKKRSGVLGWLLAGRDAVMEKKTEIEDVRTNLDKYDLIFVGCPNWAANIAPALRTYLASVNLADKKLALFCTQDSTGAERVFNNLRRMTKGAEIISEKYFNKVDKNKEIIRLQIKDWLEKLPINNES